MASWLNRMVAGSLPVIPRAIVGKVARRYIAGDQLTDAIATVVKLRDDGFLSTLDVLGEEVERAEQAEQVVAEYIALLDGIHESAPSAGVSLKLTQLGMRVDVPLCKKHLRRVVEAARERGIFVRVDMEDATLTTATLELVASMRAEGWKNVGVVVQSCLRRTEADVEELVRADSNVRLCKGIYKEDEDIAFQDGAEITENFIQLGKRLLSSGTYVGVATHDTVIIDALRAFIVEHGIPPERYEFQALLGVPITALLGRLVQEGHRVRLYIPYGSDWYAYSVRRLQENPDMAGHVLRGLFRRDR